jgi:hypothetical protein
VNTYRNCFAGIQISTDFWFAFDYGQRPKPDQMDLFAFNQSLSNSIKDDIDQARSFAN